MKCTDKEQETCEVEKRGCKGCAYYEDVTDINVGSIEEAIEILKNAIRCNEIQFEELGTHILLQDDEQKAIKIVLDNLERQKQINEEHRKINRRIKRKSKRIRRRKPDV